MRNDIKHYGKGFALALWSVGLFAAVHILMCLLNTCMLPSTPPWTVTSLWIEVGFAALALIVSLAALIGARRAQSESLRSFRRVFDTLRSAGFYLTAVWFIWCCLAFFLAMREGWGGVYHNARYLFYLTASLIVLFPLGIYLGQENKRALLHLLYDLCLLCLFVLIVYCFYRFFRGGITFKAFYKRKISFKPARVQFALNANTTGSYCAFLLVGGLYRMGTLKKAWQKALLIAALIPIAAAFAMVECRSALTGAAAAVGFLCSVSFYRNREKKGAGTVLLSVLIFIVSAGLFVGAFYILRSLLHTMQKQVIYYYRQRTYSRTDKTHELIGNKGSGIVSRGKIWKSVIQGVAHNWHLLLHGCTQSSTASTVFSFMGKNYNTHNQILEVLLSYGLPAAILFLVWLFWAAGRSLALGFSPAETDDGRWRLPLLLLVLVINNMAETMLVARGHFVGGFFFLIAGYVAGLAPPKKKQQTRKEER